MFKNTRSRRALRQSPRYQQAQAFSRKLLCSALVAALASGAAPAALAADRYWDPNGTALGVGGSGTWNLGNLNWSPNGDGTSGPFEEPWNNAALDDAFFGGTAGTVTLGDAITAHNLTFSVGGYVLTGNTLTLGGAGSTISTVGTTQINSVVAGNAGLGKAGTGTLQLGGVNTFSGAILIFGGTLHAASDQALGVAGNDITTAAGASVGLRIDGDPTSRSVTIGDGGTLTVSGAGVGSALISGNGRVNVAASNNDATIVRLTNPDNSYTGATIFNACNGVCSAYFSSIGNLGELSSLGAPTTVEDGTIIFNQSSQYSDNVVYIGDGDSSNRNWDINGSTAVIRNQGTGTLEITGDIDVSVGASFSAEGADFALLGTLSGGAYGFNTDAGRRITLGGANSFTGLATIQGLVEAPVLADGGTASSLGAGTDITMVNGTLSYTGAGGSSDRSWLLNGQNAIRNDGSGALDLDGGLAFNPVNPVDSLTLGGSHTGVSSISGVISGNGDLVADGAGTWSLDGANTFAGSVTVNDGVLRMGNANAFANVSGFTVDGGTFDLDGFDLVMPSIAGSGGTITLGSGTLTVNAASAQSYGGSISGTGGLTKAGAGTLTLTGASSYSGPTTLNGGRLVLDFSGDGGPTDGILSSASQLVLSGGALDVLGAAGENNTQAFNGLAVSAGNNTVGAVAGAGGAVDVSLGAITRTGGLVDFALPEAGAISTSTADGVLGGWATVGGTDYAKVAGGNIVAFEDTDYTDKDDASTWLDGEIISDTGGAADTPFFGTTSGDVALGGLRYTARADSTVTLGTGTTLSVDGTIIVAPSVVFNDQTIRSGAITGGAGGGALGVQHNGQGDFTIASTIVDNGGATPFVKGGSGLVVLEGTNTYTGSTTISDGTLRVSSIGNGGVASSVGASTADPANLVLEGGTLLYTGGTGTTDRGFTLVNGGTSRTIEVSNAGTDLSFTGLVTSSDDAGLTKAGPGTLTLANDTNDYVGVTTVSGGTLAATTLADGGQASSIGAASSDPANIVLDGGALGYTGVSRGSDRGMTFGAGGGGIGVTDTATTLTLSGMLTGTSLRKTGPGTLVLSGANTYANGTSVNAGTLRAGAENVFGTGGMTVAAGALLDLDGFDNRVTTFNGAGDVDLGSGTLTVNSGGTFTGTISGTGGLARAGNNQFTLSLAGCNNTYTGATTITASTTLSVDCLANGGQASGIGASGSAPSNLVFNNGFLQYTGGSVLTDRGFTLAGSTGIIRVTETGTTLEFSGDITGPGSLRKEGGGTLVLSGTNGSTGNARIMQGTLRAGSTTALGSGVLTLDDTAGVVFDLAGFDNNVSFVSGAGANGGLIELGGATFTINTGGSLAGANFGGTIAGSGNLVKNGGSTQQLSGCGSYYDGVTTVNAGTLAVACLEDGGFASSIGASSADPGNLVLNGGTLQYIGAGDSTDRRFTLGVSNNSRLDASGTGAVAFTNTADIVFSTANAAQRLTLAGTNTGDNTLAARIADNGTGLTDLFKTGAGTWILTNAGSDYTGITQISGGVLGVDKLSDGGQPSSIGASSSAASNLVIGNNSTLRYTGSGDSTDRLFTLSQGVTYIESSGTGAVAFTNTGAITLQGNQSHVLALGGTNDDLNILAGSIGDAALGETVLAKNDGGTWVLTGNHSYTGLTNINNGLLYIGNGGTTGSIASDQVNNFGGLVFNRSDTLVYGGTIDGTGLVLQAGTGTTILAGDSSYSGGTIIQAGTLQLGNGGTTGSIIGNVSNDGTLAFNRSDAYAFGGVISSSGRVLQAGTGTTVLSGTNSYAGGTFIEAGTLQVSSDANLGAASGSLTFTGGTLHSTASMASGRDVTLSGAGTLLTEAGTAFQLEGTIAGAGTLTKAGAGTLVLTADNTYSGGTTIAGGMLQVGTGGTSGWILGDVANNGVLAFSRSDDVAFGGLVSGTGQLVKYGAGMLTLSADNSYTGDTLVDAGTLLVNGNQASATGTTTVGAGATLGGTGVLGGDVVIDAGGTLSPGASAGTLTIGGDLSLSAGSTLDFEFGEVEVAGGPLNDLVEVGGDLVLDGTINVSVSAGGDFGIGTYHVFNYGGLLTDHGLELGTMPAGSDVTVQVAVPGQVNLVNSAGLELSYWDGDAGPKANDVVDGGDGVWELGGSRNNWTDPDGRINAAYANGSFAVFTGTGGTVTVDNGNGKVTATGMQFASDGYRVTGDDIGLVDTEAVVRVGDGSVDGADMTATIGNVLTGTGALVKTDLGTLVLTADNIYSGGTRISEGTLQLGDGGTSGWVLGAIANDGTLVFDRSDDVVFNRTISGGGQLVQQGSGVLTLEGANSYAGGTVLADGTVRISDGDSLGTGGLVFRGGTLHTTADLPITRDAVLEADGVVLTDANTVFTLDSVVSGVGGLVKSGAGALVLSRDNTYTGGTTIATGSLMIGSGGMAGSIVGDIANNGRLIFNRFDDVAFDGLISGSGNVIKRGAGVLTLGANNSHGGGTEIHAGTLRISADANLGAAPGTLTFYAGTLNTTADIASSRDVILAGDGTLQTDAGTTLALDGLVSGAGALLKSGDGTLVLSGANSYGGGTRIDAGTLQISSDGNLGDAAGQLVFAGGTLHSTSDIISGREVGLLGAGTMLTDVGTTFRLEGVITGDGAFTKAGAGTLVLTADGGYTGGTTIDGGTLQLGDGGTSGWIDGDVANEGVLAFNRLDDVTFAGRISGSGALVKQDTGNVLTLTADNSYTGGTTIAGGTLQLGDGGSSGWILGDVTNNDTLLFNRSDDVTFDGLVSGDGNVLQIGPGVVELTADNTYKGETGVIAGTLLVNGDQSEATGRTVATTGATLGGGGTIGGDVVIAGATLAPGSADATPGVLTIGGSLSLDGDALLAYDFGEADVVGGAFNDLVEVAGDLELDGRLDVVVSPGRSFGPGVYRVFNYGGALGGPGLTLGTLPGGSDFHVQTSVANQVNLVNTDRLVLRFWDGAAGGRNDDAITGGDGVWQNDGGNDNWTLEDGSINAPFQDGAFAVFQGVGGTVTVDGSLGAINVAGMQIAADGYAIEGDRIQLAGSQARVRVGDGTVSGAGYTATIASELAGAAELVKSDAGTLVLSGANTYAGGTRIDGGTLRISDDANLGASAGALAFDGGVLNTTADIASGRDFLLDGAGSVDVDGDTTLALAGVLSGEGAFSKLGQGTLLLSGSGRNAGGMAVEAGTLLVDGDYAAAAGPTDIAGGAMLAGAGTLGGDVSLGDGATLSPGSDGPGTFTIGGNLSLASGSRLDFEFGEANAVGGALNDLVEVGGDLVLDGTLDVRVAAGGAFDPGVYRVFNYGGALTDNGLSLGTLPAGSTASVQTAIAGQVNLVNTGGLTLNFWDGQAGPKSDGTVNGGDGLWQGSAGNDNWTDENGQFNAAYTDGSFAIFAGSAGTVEVDNSLGAVTASGMQFATDGYTIAGDALALVGPEATIRVGDGSTDGAGFTATVAATLAGDAQLVKTDAGTLVLTGSNSYTGGTRIAGGTLQIGSDANLGAGATNVVLDGGTLASSADLSSQRLIQLAGNGTIATAAGTAFTFEGVFTGAGTLTKAGEGTLLVLGDNDAHAGAVSVAAGALDVRGRLGGAVNVGADGRLQGTGRVGSIANSGVVAPGASIGTLTVARAYSGNGGRLEIEAVLGDDSSAADRLVVNGATSGNTVVSVINLGGEGGQTVEGIKIVEVAGASNGSFTLDGDYQFDGEPAVIAGAYGYRLYKNGVSDPDDGDWYLRSALLDGGSPNPPTDDPLFQPGVPVYEGYARTLLALNGLSTLQQRIGNRFWAAAPVEGKGVWGRVEGGYYRPQAVASTTGADLSIDTWQMQLGIDSVLSAREDGSAVVGGLFLHRGRADAGIRSVFGNGSIDTLGYGVGASLTWYGVQGLYVDGQVKVSRFDSDLDSAVLGSLLRNNDGRGQALGLEIGRRFALDDTLWLTPQFQTAYSKVDFDRVADPAGAVVSARDSSSLKTRAGLSLDRQALWTGAAGDVRRTHLYGIANLSYEWRDHTGVEVADTPVGSRDHRAWGELGFGGSYNWGDGAFTLYGEVSADTPLSDFGDAYNYRATVGFRANF